MYTFRNSLLILLILKRGRKSFWQGNYWYHMMTVRWQVSKAFLLQYTNIILKLGDRWLVFYIHLWDVHSDRERKTSFKPTYLIWCKMYSAFMTHAYFVWMKWIKSSYSWLNVYFCKNNHGPWLFNQNTVWLLFIPKSWINK